MSEQYSSPGHAQALAANQPPVPVIARNLRWYLQWLHHYRLNPRWYRYAAYPLDLYGYRGLVIRVLAGNAYTVEQYDGRNLRAPDDRT
jgi:hypothetical protein